MVFSKRTAKTELKSPILLIKMLLISLKIAHFEFREDVKIDGAFFSVRRQTMAKF